MQKVKRTQDTSYNIVLVICRVSVDSILHIILFHKKQHNELLRSVSAEQPSLPPLTTIVFIWQSHMKNKSQYNGHCLYHFW